MAASRPVVLLLNASLGGATGNTAALLARAHDQLAPQAETSSLTLADGLSYIDAEPLLTHADALLIGTGTHWDSWSHHLQKFLEDATPGEGTSLWLGKPAAVIVTAHSVGGKGVLSRLQGVLNTFGCTIPPMSGLVYSLAQQTLIASQVAGADDTWSPEDIEVICHNLLAALTPVPRYRAWPVDRRNYAARWIE